MRTTLPLYWYTCSFLRGWSSHHVKYACASATRSPAYRKLRGEGRIMVQFLLSPPWACNGVAIRGEPDVVEGCRGWKLNICPITRRKRCFETPPFAHMYEHGTMHTTSFSVLALFSGTHGLCQRTCRGCEETHARSRLACTVPRWPLTLLP